MILRVLAGLVALLALLLGSTLLVLRTHWGSERLRRQVVSRVNRQIQGTLAMDRLSFGGDKLIVWGVALRDPEGQLVVQVARAEVDASLVRLLHHEVRIIAVEIETPILSIVSSSNGSNLARATAPRQKMPAKPPEPEKKGTEEGWVVRVDRFDLTRGDVSLGTATDDGHVDKLHLAAIGVFASVRYATGNGSLELSLRVSGDSQLVPVGPLRLSAQLAAHGNVYRVDADGELLGGTLKVHGSLDSEKVEASEGFVALQIPRQSLAGHEWGPLSVNGQARPGTNPTLKVLLDVPGVELAINDRGAEALGIRGRLTVSDLGLMARALQALSGGAVSPMAGRGGVDFGLEKSGTGSGADARLKGAFDELRFGDTVLNRLELHGDATQLSSRPGSAAFGLSVASLESGTSRFGGVALSANLARQDLAASFSLAAPARVDLSLAARLDDDRQGLSLTNLVLAYPEGRWATEGTTRARFDAKELSLSHFRLVSDGQSLAIDGSRRGDELAAHLVLTALQLGRLPTVLIDPALRLEGALDLDVKAEGRIQSPKVVARLELKQGRYQGFSKLDAKVGATLENDEVEATAAVEAPFASLNAEAKLPIDLLDAGAAIHLQLDVKHLDVGQVLRGAEKPPLGDGRVNIKLALDGSAANPRLDLGLEAFDLAINKKGKGAGPIDLGHAHVHVTYADRAARAELDFKSAHGGTLAVDATTRVDLSYPPVKRPIVAAKLPVHGKIVARALDVAWLSQFNPRVESLGGQVTADARLEGTVGDPQFVGDVRWKNGEVVATTPPPNTKSANPKSATPERSRPGTPAKKNSAP